MSELTTGTEIKVTVTFPITKKGPFDEQVTLQTTVGTVREAAMRHFGVQDDAQFTYVLAHDGVEQGNSRTIEEVAGSAEAVKFTLVKKIAQG
jgi:hypothetical protein